jgi:hypothetical protein
VSRSTPRIRAARTEAAARREAGLKLLITRGYRSDAEQARRFAAKPTPLGPDFAPPRRFTRSCSGGDEQGEGECDERVSARGWYRAYTSRERQFQRWVGGEFLERLGEHLGDERGQPSADQAAERELGRW